MKTIAVSGKVALLALTLIASRITLAQNSGWYGGGNLGQSHATIDDGRIRGGLQAGGFATSSINNDERDFGYKVFGGYQFNRYFALEAGYFDLGKFSFHATTIPAGTLDGSLKLKGGNLDAVGLLPITGDFSIFGRVGATYASTSDSFSGSGAVRPLDPSPSKRGFNYKLGLGLQYQITQALAMRGEVERYRINDAVGNRGDIDLVSVGLLYRFGQKSQPASPTSPEPVGPAPAAPEPVAVVPVPPSPKKVTLSADSLFEFDKATLSSSGRQALDKLATELRGGNFDAITVTGHTDRLGPYAYNLALSTRRAEAVKAALVQSSGISASKVLARGVDGSNPVTNSSECRGTKATKRLIACLAPDRRVDVEATGIR
ncbi:OmpA family protein [Caballeronia sp. SBC2]|uniref:OmpA family protein n=1 Tax=Caballeronia sp. SBC2 TaxID=2705547 RepID=UPI0013E13F8C|nr:OmpA family protein [Caballeronia sp. SBC2]QIE29521.1 Outer membrane protein A [Caballeronia sp. SBC2]